MTSSSDDLTLSLTARAFEHFIRTGEQLTVDEWSARFERKFNPNHDHANGQFTFAFGGSAARSGSGRSTGPARATTALAARVRPIADYTETGKNAWRKANDAIFEEAANDFNTANNLKPGDARYIDPQLMKAWAMVESGGNKEVVWRICTG